MEKINRNDPCPCGSGKKYKKCCGAGEAVSITHMLESEIDELQKQLIHYAIIHYGEELEEDFEDVEEVFQFEDEQEREFYEFVHTIWYSFFQPFEDGERIIDKFITTETRRIKRPKLKQILQSWTKARAIAGKVIDLNGNKLTVEDGLTTEILEVIIVNEPSEVDIGTFFIGIIVPFEQNYVFFPAPFDLPDLLPDKAFDFIKSSSDVEGYESADEYLTDFFLQVMNDLPMVEGIGDIDNLDWSAPIYKQVAEIFRERMELLSVPTPIIDMGIVLWFQFCQKKKKRIQNPNLYVAALHYLVSTIVPMDDWSTQKELAVSYGVSANGFSTIYREMDDVLSEEISELIGVIEDDEYEDGDRFESPFVEFNHQKGPLATERVLQEVLSEVEGKDFESIEEINAFINKKMSSTAPRKGPKGKKEQAQQLIYDAFEVEGKKRYQLAQRALDLDPNCVDAYVILAEKVGNLKEMAKLYEKGMRVGEKELGKAFILENKGHFWGMVETRPFMRAKFHYAECLYQLGKLDEATKQYEELLELNPNDNQGVRYSLFVAYIDIENFKKAHQLLQQYNEGTTHSVYNKLLLELHENGFSMKATKWLKDAKKKNKHVLAFVSAKKQLPKQVPDYYGFGDENEAIIYAETHLHLWKKIKGLQEWLKNQ
ncbi:MAG TPA: SEC-C metal-binding domain-containing protein [Neobacillus sp.]